MSGAAPAHGRAWALPREAPARRYARLGPWFELCLLCWIAWARPAHAAPRTAFHYGAQVPSDLIAAYDQVVVEPDHVKNLEAFRGADRARPVAYLSVGEVARNDARSKQVDRSWVIAENGAWASRVMDLAHPAYQAWLLARYEELWARGYRGFFLDTLDSYRLAASEQRDEGLRRGLVHIIRSFARRHPDARLLLNRGFEILPEVKDVVSGVVAESLFDRWDAATQSYRRVPEADRRWLLAELTRVRDRLGLPVIVIDYRPEAERPQARETARKIAALGFEPWVTNATLDAVGVGSLEILPRRVLILHNDRVVDAGAPASAGAPSAASGASVPDGVRFLGPVLEYLGYVPEARRVPADLAELDPILAEGLQGVITWFGSSALPPGYADWMAAQQRRGLRFVLFGAPGFDVASARGKALGLSLIAPASASPARPIERDALIGFEAEPPLRPFDGPLIALRDAPGNRVHLRLRDERGREGVAVATTNWGGFALSHALALRGLAGERAWVIDPLAFLRRALSLPDAPMPNVTTENGRRLALHLVRPEGLATPAGPSHPSNATALATWLSSTHAWPHALATHPSDPATPPSGADIEAAQRLLELDFFEQANLLPGAARAHEGRLSLTNLTSLLVTSGHAEPGARDVAGHDAGLGASGAASSRHHSADGAPATPAGGRSREGGFISCDDPYRDNVYRDNYSGDTATPAGHGSGGRGCIGCDTAARAGSHGNSIALEVSPAERTDPAVRCVAGRHLAACDVAGRDAGSLARVGLGTDGRDARASGARYRDGCGRELAGLAVIRCDDPYRDNVYRDNYRPDTATAAGEGSGGRGFIGGDTASASGEGSLGGGLVGCDTAARDVSRGGPVALEVGRSAPTVRDGSVLGVLVRDGDATHRAGNGQGGGRGSERSVVGPVALDSLFLPRGGPQAYPYREVLGTFAAMEAPRRLAPVLVDYHGYSIGNAGGRAALGSIFEALEGSELFPMFVSAYVARVRAFAEVVVARSLDGSFHYFGGEALRTVRAPVGLGWPIEIGAQGAVVMRRGPDGIYVSFVAEGARRLALGAREIRVPHLVQVNGRVLAFETTPEPTARSALGLPGGSVPGGSVPGGSVPGGSVPGGSVPGGSVLDDAVLDDAVTHRALPERAMRSPDSEQASLARFSLEGHVALELELAGLPPNARCVVAFDGGIGRGVSDARGALKLALGVKRTGAARLSCGS